MGHGQRMHIRHAVHRLGSNSVLRRRSPPWRIKKAPLRGAFVLVRLAQAGASAAWRTEWGVRNQASQPLPCRTAWSTAKRNKAGVT